MRTFYFLHDQPFTQHTASVKAYDLRQARKILRKNFPLPHGWKFYSMVWKFEGDVDFKF